HEPRARQRLRVRRHLPRQRVEVRFCWRPTSSISLPFGALGYVREQVAERTALVAERDVDVTVQVPPVLAAPGVAQRNGGLQRPVRLLVRVAVDVAGIGAVAQLLAQPPADLTGG